MGSAVVPCQDLLEATREKAHPACAACGSANPLAMGLRFRVREDGGVEASFACDELYQGYPGVLHGGITSMLLDSAMTNCLFAHGAVAVTARLIVRYSRPVATDHTAAIRAWLRNCSPPLFVLEAELAQGGLVMAHASGKFIDREGI